MYTKIKKKYKCSMDSVKEEESHEITKFLE